MINSSDLNKMSQINICEINPDALVKTSSIYIDSQLPQTEKIERYLEQIQNPYCFMSGDTPVRIRFAKTERTLSQSLIEYFSRLKQK